tara:strand:- start:242 stop:1006 length:765 start_codon:yes stop_codon:yes gene_type:complete
MAKIKIIASKESFETAPFYVAPRWDSVSKKFLSGQQDMSKEELEKVSLVIDEETSIAINHGQELDTENNTDLQILNLLKHVKEIAPDKMNMNPAYHRFYLQDLEGEAKHSIGKSKVKFECYDYVRNLSLKEMSDFGRVIGVKVKNMSGTQIEAAIFDKIESDPKHVRGCFKDTDMKTKVFVDKLIEKGVVVYKGSKYYYGDEMIAINMDYLVEYVKDRSNAPVVNQWAELVDPSAFAKKKAKPKKEQVETKTEG